MVSRVTRMRRGRTLSQNHNTGSGDHLQPAHRLSHPLSHGCRGWPHHRALTNSQGQCPKRQKQQSAICNRIYCWEALTNLEVLCRVGDDVRLLQEDKWINKKKLIIIIIVKKKNHFNTEQIGIKVYSSQSSKSILFLWLVCKWVAVVSWWPNQTRDENQPNHVLWDLTHVKKPKRVF